MNRIQKIGMPPGSLVHVGKRKMEHTRLTVIDYSSDELAEEEITDLNKIRDYKERDTVTWLNVDGVHDPEIIERIGHIFDIHPLVLEDVMNTDQRPKADFYGAYGFVIIRMLNYNEYSDMFESEQLSLILGKSFVITFQEEPGDVFDMLRDRIRQGLKVREKGPDYLAYSLLDLVVDSYFRMLERMGEWIESLEDEVIKRPDQKRSMEINDLKRDMNYLRRSTWPVREVVHGLQRHEESLISSETRVYLNDLYDHIIQVIESMENYRDMVANLMDLYLSNISYKMNEVMKTLTVVTTIFIPMTFLTSVYGMNFVNMPELKSPHAYFVLWGVILAMGIGMAVYFKRRGWF